MESVESRIKQRLTCHHFFCFHSWTLYDKLIPRSPLITGKFDKNTDDKKFRIHSEQYHGTNFCTPVQRTLLIMPQAPSQLQRNIRTNKRNGRQKDKINNREEFAFLQLSPTVRSPSCSHHTAISILILGWCS